MQDNNKQSAGVAVDHLLIGTPDLDQGCQWVSELFGASPVIGGCHPDHGTRNALLGLDNDVYIEILAPDPEQSDNLPNSRYLQRLKETSLMWWAARFDDFDLIANLLQQQNIPIRSRDPWSRQLPDGQELKWQLLIPGASNFNAALPFFIDWNDMDHHPSHNLPTCGVLKSLRISHLEVENLQQILGTSQHINYRQQASQLTVELNINNKIICLNTPNEFPIGMGEID